MIELDKIGGHLGIKFYTVRQILLGMPRNIFLLVQAVELISGVRIVLELSHMNSLKIYVC